MATLTNVSPVGEYKETYMYNILSAVPGSSPTTDSIIDLPAGTYRIIGFSTVTGASDSTLALSIYLDKNRTFSMTVAISSITSTGTETRSTSVTLVTAGNRFFVSGSGGTVATSISASVPVAVPYGVTWTWTKGAGTPTALNVVLVFERIG